MRFLDSLFFAHPRSVNETYWQHFYCALTVSLRLLYASIFQLLHAVIPGIHPPYGTDLRSLAKYCDSRLPEKRKNEPKQK